MDDNSEALPGRVRLAGFDDDDSPTRQAVATRDGGLRRLRRVSNWTAAALIAGTAATTGYFAHLAAVVPVPAAAGTTAQTNGTTAVGTSLRPSVSNPVATSSGSGVTVGTSANTVGGGTVSGTTVTGVGTVGTWRDN